MIKPLEATVENAQALYKLVQENIDDLKEFCVGIEDAKCIEDERRYLQKYNTTERSIFGIYDNDEIIGVVTIES